MSDFTMRLSEVLEITDDIGLSDYPIFDESYRESLNKKIVDQYLLQEIGCETIEMFRLFMSRKMHQIMPFYNRLYESERLSIDPLLTMSMKTVTSGTESGTTDSTSDSTGTNNSTADSKSRAVVSQTPQTMLSGNADYASGATDSTSLSTNAGNANEKTTQEQSATAERESSTLVEGWTGSQSDLLNLYRSTFLNIDMMIIGELSNLFMIVWDSGDNRFSRSPDSYYGYNYLRLGVWW